MPERQDFTPAKNNQPDFQTVKEYIPPFWIRDGLDNAKLNPDESDRDELDRILREESGVLRSFCGRIGCSLKPARKLLTQMRINPTDYLVPQLEPGLTISQITREKRRASAIIRWARERTKREQGLPSLFDRIHSPEADEKRKTPRKTYWNTEEGKRRKAINAGQIKARAKTNMSNALSNNPKETLEKDIRKYGVAGTARHLGKSKGTIQEWAAQLDVPTSMQYRPSRYKNQAIVEEAEKSGQLSSLPPRHKAVLEARYLTEKPSTLADLGREFQISRQAVWKIEKDALEQLAQVGKSQED